MAIHQAPHFSTEISWVGGNVSSFPKKNMENKYTVMLYQEQWFI